MPLTSIQKLALEFWQNNLAKFTPKRKTILVESSLMFEAGYKQAIEDALNLPRPFTLEAYKSNIRSLLEVEDDTN